MAHLSTSDVERFKGTICPDLVNLQINFDDLNVLINNLTKELNTFDEPLAKQFREIASYSGQTRDKINSLNQQMDSELSTFIASVKKSEKNLAQWTKNTQDMFAEAANIISKLTV